MWPTDMMKGIYPPKRNCAWNLGEVIKKAEEINSLKHFIDGKVNRSKTVESRITQAKKQLPARVYHNGILYTRIIDYKNGIVDYKPH